eukprot:745743-Hanusia_phi.AAC.2
MTTIESGIIADPRGVRCIPTVLGGGGLEQQELSLEDLDATCRKSEFGAEFREVRTGFLPNLYELRVRWCRTSIRICENCPACKEGRHTSMHRIVNQSSERYTTVRWEECLALRRRNSVSGSRNSGQADFVPDLVSLDVASSVSCLSASHAEVMQRGCRCPTESSETFNTTSSNCGCQLLSLPLFTFRTSTSKFFSGEHAAGHSLTLSMQRVALIEVSSLQPTQAIGVLTSLDDDFDKQGLNIEGMYSAGSTS